MVGPMEWHEGGPISPPTPCSVCPMGFPWSLSTGALPALDCSMCPALGHRGHTGFCRLVSHTQLKAPLPLPKQSGSRSNTHFPARARAEAPQRFPSGLAFCPAFAPQLPYLESLFLAFGLAWVQYDPFQILPRDIGCASLHGNRP